MTYLLSLETQKNGRSSFIQTNAAYGYKNLENLLRLEKSLKGEALEFVESMLIHPDSVNDIMAELEFRFGRSDLLIRSQMNKVKAIQPIREADLSQLFCYTNEKFSDVYEEFKGRKTFTESHAPGLTCGKVTFVSKS